MGNDNTIYGILGSTLRAIANAIRGKTGGSAAIPVSSFASQINSIETGGEIEALNVTGNGTYTASGGVDGYSPVTVNVANTYTAGDEGKVVSSGALISQGTEEITQNGVYDTTEIRSVTVAVAMTGLRAEGTGTYDFAGDLESGAIAFSSSVTAELVS